MDSGAGGHRPRGRRVRHDRAHLCGQWRKVESALSLPASWHWLPPWRRNLSLCCRWQVSAYVTGPWCFVPHFLSLSSGWLSFTHVASILSCWLYGLLGLIFYMYPDGLLPHILLIFLPQSTFGGLLWAPCLKLQAQLLISLLFLFPALFFSQALITFSFTIWYSFH